MKRPGYLRRTLAGLLLSLVLLPAASRAEEPLRVEIGKPLQAAQELIKAQRYKDALVKVREAEAVTGRSAYENYIIDRMRAAAASGAGDNESAIKAYETVLASGKLPAAEHLKVMEALAGTYYRAKDYPHAVSTLQQYLKQGGNSAPMRNLLIQSLYFSDDWAGASKELTAVLTEDEQAGRVPAETQLQLLANCHYRSHDNAGYVATLERLVSHYPKKEYWTDLIARLQSKPGFADRLALDVYRLRHASGNLKETAAYVEYAQLALQAGYPAEARQLVDEGFANALLGAGADAARHKRLRELANRQASEDRQAQDRKNAVTRDGSALVNDGYAYVTQGQFDKGIAMIEQGISKPGVKHLDDARLHLGIAYLQAGNKARAVQTFKAVPRGSDGVGDLARLWGLWASLK